MRKVAIAWLLVWALSYMAVAAVAPQIGGDSSIVSAIEYFLVGTWIALTTYFYAYVSKHRISGTPAMVVMLSLAFIAVFETVGAVSSWTGSMGMWVLPYANYGLAQISMAFADMISAFFACYLAIVELL